MHGRGCRIVAKCSPQVVIISEILLGIEVAAASAFIVTHCDIVGRPRCPVGAVGRDQIGVARDVAHTVKTRVPSLELPVPHIVLAGRCSITAEG